MRRAVRTILTAAALAFVLALGGVWAQNIEESPEDLPAGEGRETTFYACVACHGSAIIRSQGLSRERWSQTIEDMKLRGMPELGPDEREAVLGYLSATYPPRRREPTNPFLRP